MLKKIYIKNGIIFVSEKKNMEINYNIINNYDKNKNKNDIIKEYYKSKGMIYN
uniref:Uncharacterized protein n=1 Tax=viral metagenome TaxID=1070528 RepID=A0A6C0C494_9ZZZZ